MVVGKTRADITEAGEASPSGLVRRFHDAVVNGHAVDGLDELVAPDYVNHGPFPWGVHDFEDLARFSLVSELGFPDVQVVTEALLEVGDTVAYRVTIRGTDTGEFLGLEPTGRAFEVAGSGFVRVRDGRIAEHWGFVDDLGLLEQIGADLASIRLAAPAGMRRRIRR